MWKRKAIIFGFLVYFLIFWFVFSGIFNFTFAIFAMISIFISFYVNKAFFFDKEECMIFPSFSFIRYLGVIIKDVFLSSLAIVKLMIKYRGVMPEIKIKTISFKITNPHIRSFIENSITITPGTFVINSDDETILASAIDEKSMTDLENRRFISKIYSIFKKFNFNQNS
jgi:multicomponent Na+:H+ antiporter subunit E